VFRLLLVVVCLVAGAVWVDASWSSDRRALTLRLRGTSEVVETLRESSRELGRRAVSRARDRLPAVASPPAAPGRERPRRSSSEHITVEEQEHLDRLIVEKTGEN
jgi:hypothetical protein